MAEGRSVVVTGASRGLGLATAARLHQRGWMVVAAMRTPEEGMPRLLRHSGASDGDPRLIGVRLDVDDPASIASAADAIRAAVGAPFGLVHNAGIAGVGTVEEMPQESWEHILSTNFLGPVRLTRELLPDMRAAGRGRILMVSSAGAVRGMPGIGAYSAAKGALERWAESLSAEVAPFGLGVTVLVAGTFRTDVLELTPSWADTAGPYAAMHDQLERNGRRYTSLASDPDRFARAVAAAMESRRPFVRRGVGLDARALLLGSRLLPGGLLQAVVTRALRLPRPRASTPVGGGS